MHTSQSTLTIIPFGETFMKRYEIEKITNKAEMTSEEQSEKTVNFGGSLWNEIQLKGPQRRKWTKRRELKKKKKKGVG